MYSNHSTHPQPTQITENKHSLLSSDEMSDDRNGNYSQAIDNAFAKDPQIIMLVMKSPNEEK